jgi:hypothetical protein
MPEMLPPGMGFMATEVQMVVSGEVPAHRRLRPRLTFWRASGHPPDSIETERLERQEVEKWTRSTATRSPANSSRPSATR